MATLKEHQAAMVDLLANGSGIPASASRLAHAMHDVLSAILSEPDLIAKAIAESKAIKRSIAETTSGLNDKALSKREKALKTDSPAKWPTPAEQRVKELENTIRQLKANNAKLRAEIGLYKEQRDALGRQLAESYLPEQAGCRREDTQMCEHDFRLVAWCSDLQQCSKCGETKQ
jgi:predicted RNase H-like nuclease (RuvC/YqgF family)